MERSDTLTSTTLLHRSTILAQRQIVARVCNCQTRVVSQRLKVSFALRETLLLGHFISCFCKRHDKVIKLPLFGSHNTEGNEHQKYEETATFPTPWRRCFLLFVHKTASRPSAMLTAAGNAAESIFCAASFDVVVVFSIVWLGTYFCAVVLPRFVCYECVCACVRQSGFEL